MNHNTTDYGQPLRTIEVKCHKVPHEVKYDGEHHFIGRIAGGQEQCAQCGIKVQKKCNKYGMALHDRCFERNHTK